MFQAWLSRMDNTKNGVQKLKRIKRDRNWVNLENDRWLCLGKGY